MRNAVVSEWLSQTEWANWHRTPMTGDASARRYERLVADAGTSVILMDAPPETCGSQTLFSQIAEHLRGIGLVAPDVLAWNDVLGLMILEDLGRVDFAQHLRSNPQDERRLYEAAVDVLMAIGLSPAPSGLKIMTPDIGANMIDIAFEWAAVDHSAALSGEIKGNLKELLSTVAPNPTALSLRDYHAENLIWRPDEPPTRRVGLLDFQDAFITHPAYDLASLLRDARRDVDPDLVDPVLKRMGGEEDMKAAFHIMAVQRNLRILGIFERLTRRHGKVSYLNLIPRVRGHLQTDLGAPELARLAPLVRRAFSLNDGNPK